MKYWNEGRQEEDQEEENENINKKNKNKTTKKKHLKKRVLRPKQNPAKLQKIGLSFILARRQTKIKKLKQPKRKTQKQNQ